jgi:hypothetical protein
MATRATYALLAIGLGVTWMALASASPAASRRTLDGCLLGLGFALWSTAPFAGLGWAAWRWRAAPPARTILLVAAGLLAAAQFHFWRVGALVELALLFLPVWESIAVVVFVVLAASRAGVDTG